MGFSRQEYWSGLPCPPPGDPLNPGIKPRSPPLQADSLPSETPGKPKNTGKVSLSLLQGIFLMQESNWGLLHCRWILYRLRYQESTLWSCTHTNLVSNSILLKLCRRKNTRLLLPWILWHSPAWLYNLSLLTKICKMAVQKDMHSSSPVRTTKLQLTAEQQSTGECWIPPKRYPTSKGKREAQARWYEG